MKLFALVLLVTLANCSESPKRPDFNPVTEQCLNREPEPLQDSTNPNRHPSLCIDRVYIDETDTFNAKRRVSWQICYVYPDTHRLIVNYPTPFFPMKRISSIRGEVLDYGLPNGTQVAQNTNTVLKYGRKGAYCEVAGEVLLKTNKQPTTIQVADVAVYLQPQSLVNIKNRITDTTLGVAVIKGIAKLNHNGQVTVVKPGQMARYNNNGDVLITQCDTEEILAWSEGWIHSDSISLTSVLQILGDWYDKELVFSGPRDSSIKGLGLRFIDRPWDPYMMERIKEHFKFDYVVSNGQKYIFQDTTGISEKRYQAWPELKEDTAKVHH